jgi:hypothetical protein
MRFQISEADQKEFGAPEFLEFDLRAISAGDLEELSERHGFDPMDWPDPWIGELTLDMAGDPGAQPKPPPWRNRALAWMLLRQNGIDVSWEEAGKARVFLMRRIPEPDEPSPGKDATEETDSDPSDASTTPPSDTSTA